MKKRPSGTACPVPWCTNTSKTPPLWKRPAALCARARETTSFGCGYDLRWNPRRFAYYLVHMQRYFKKFKTYYK